MSLGEAVQTVITNGPEDAFGKDTGLFADIQQYFKDFLVTMKGKGYAFDVFEKNLFFLKALGLIFIIILAIVNYSLYKDSGLIKKEPLTFFTESLIFAVGGLLPFLLLCYLRNNVYPIEKVVKMSIVVFIVFFALNYLLELSGFYSWTFKPSIPKSDEEKACESVVEKELSYSDKMSKSLGRTTEILMIALVAGSFFALIFSTFFVMDTTPTYTRTGGMPTLLVFLIEMILFGVISAVPIFLMAKNRDDLSVKTTAEFFVIFGKFVFLHCLLQISGFYHHAFNPQSPA
jgi:hypothetical protein